MAIIKVIDPTVKDIWASDDKIFHLAESEDFVSITYETNKLYDIFSDNFINSLVTIDLRRDLTDGNTALVLEWFPSVAGHYYYLFFSVYHDSIEFDEVFP